MGGIRSLTMYVLESKEMIPPLLPEKIAPQESTLGLTSARISGPPFCGNPPAQRYGSGLPSRTTPALRGSVNRRPPPHQLQITTMVSTHAKVWIDTFVLWTPSECSGLIVSGHASRKNGP